MVKWHSPAPQTCKLITKNIVYAIVACVAVFAGSVWAAPVDYRLSFDGVLDNREYGGGPTKDETFFFARPEAEAGFRLDDSHRIAGGLTYTQEFGAPEAADNLHPLMYYRYEGDGGNTRFRFGAFPRFGALDLPEWFFSDDAAYARPFVHGAALGIDRWGAAFSVWVDWTGRQADTVREAFLFGYGAGYGYGMFFARHDFIMYHLAAPGIPVPDDHVKDNGGLSAEAGGGGRVAFVDSLSLSAGGVVSLDRDRGDGVWHTPVGGFVRGYAAKGWFALRGAAYSGEPQRLVWGDSFYGLNSFGRVDLIARFVSRRGMEAGFFQSVHFFSGKAGYSQHFVLRAEFAGF